MTSKNNPPSMKLALGLVSLIAIITTCLSVAFYFKYSDLKKTITNPSSLVSLETTSLIGKVGKLMKLPAGMPTIATINDIKQARKQAFFQNAQNGDKVLIYSDAKIAILYRPSNNQIINVGPVNTPTPTTTITATASATPKAELKQKTITVQPTIKEISLPEKTE